MKKVYLGLFVAAFMISGCGTAGNASDSTTESSLRKEISKLEQQNTELQERVTAFEQLVEGFTTESAEEEQSATPTVFKIGESAEFNSGEKITVTEIKADDAVELQDKEEGEHPVVVTATVENTTSAPISYNTQVFDLYDGNDELARFDSSTYSNNIPHEIAGGKKATVVMHFGSKQGAPYSVSYGEATWSTN